MMTNFYARLVLAVVIVYMLAQVAPKAVNAILILILVGIVLMRFPAFQSLFASTIGALGKTK